MTAKGSTKGERKPTGAMGPIRLQGVRQNNLDGFDTEIPRGSLTGITGVSGSGKSSLAFDTLFREGQRRFLETLSAYARQFVGRMEKPDVEHIEGLAPAIAVDQRSVPRGARSTVGTLTEVFDHLRVLFARAGTSHCPDHGLPLAGRTPESVVEELLAGFDGQRVHIAAPVVRDRKGQHKALFSDLRKKGFVRARVDGEVHRLEEVPELERYVRHTVEVVVDRLRVDEEARGRIREAVATGLEFGGGDLVVFGDGLAERSWSTSRACKECGREAPPLEPRLFSFNSPHGACEQCEGIGVLRLPTMSKVVADPALSIREGALAVTRARGGALLFPKADFEFLERVARENDFDLDTPWCDLSEGGRRAVLYGTGEARYTDYSNWAGSRGKGQLTWKRKYRGVLPAIERSLAQGSRRKQLTRFLGEETCPACRGSRLGEHARNVKVGGRSIDELLEAPIADLAEVLDSLALSDRERRIARDLLTEVRRRANFLLQVGLGYLTLHRSADTLSGGEAQRIRLAAQLGAGLQGVLYVLDEPSIGLHARDQALLFRALEGLRDLGNTVVVVEHDEATLRGADHLIDIGPGAGRYGGQLVASGSPAEVAKADSPTGRLLRGELPLAEAPEGREPLGESLVVRGARGNNLKGIDVELPLGLFVAVTGVSGSGKSTLVNGTLRPALMRHLELEGPDPAPHDVIEGKEAIGALIVIDASPIGRTPRSNPATYTGAWGPIRDLFAGMPDSKMRGWKPGRFSFNVPGGRCEACSGAGATYVELQFLAPVTVPCEECGGHRFGPETLGVRFKGHNIADVLALSIEEALELFGDIPKVRQPLQALVDVGLGYVQLGQPSTTLSGGEAQRIKLAKHLQKRPRGKRGGAAHSLFLLDEPTTGLHQADVQKLVTALHKLVDLGHSVVVIEHNLDLVAVADHVVDLGPEGGVGGGELVAACTPTELRDVEASHTGRALARGHAAPKGSKAAHEAGQDDFLAELSRGASHDISVRGARTHNLRAIDVDIPRGSLTVVTGPSGSGKTSLALDTIHAAGERRFVDSLSTYARQFLGTRDKPPVDRIDGLGPSVVVEARGGGAHPRSTVATATELHDYLRVLFSRAGKRRCPHHGQVLEPMDAGRVARSVAKDLDGERGWIVAPIHDGLSHGLTNEDLEGEEPLGFEDFDEARAAWIGAGFARILVDGVETRLTPDLELDAGVRRVDLVVDRLAFGADTRARIAEAVEQAETLADGRVSVLVKRRGTSPERHEYSLRGNCTVCGFGFEENLEPRHFSFNAHVGACPDCSGLGASWQCDPGLLVTHPERPLMRPEGGDTANTAIAGKLGRYLTKGKGFYEAMLREVARRHKLDLSKPWASLTEKQRDLVLYGIGARKSYSVTIEKEGRNYTMEQNYDAPWPGLCGHVDAWHKKSEDPGWSALLEESMARKPCRACGGERLAPGPRSVTVGKKRLPEVLALSVEASLAWFGKLRLAKRERSAVEAVLEEIRARLGMLDQVGLGYLGLDRSMGTLSGGELRRVRLSANLGSNLVDVCYVLDEPTVGLHPMDVDKLGTALEGMRDRGNTVLVVEHDEALMRRADHIVDIGPGAGRHGGRVVASGTVAEIEAQEDSLTGKALRGEFRLAAGGARERAAAALDGPPPVGGAIGLRGARLHNLRGIGLDLEFGKLTGVCGPSGSGKSTLVLDCLVPALRGDEPDGRWKKLVGAGDGARRVVVVDAAPIGRSPASTPATAVGLLEEVRQLYARTPEARMRGFTASHFSYNSSKGRCPACEGRGATRVDMQFLADLWLTCEECDGKRYRPEVLEVRHRGLSVADLLALSVDEAREVLAHQPKAAHILGTMAAVGLGYLALNQSSTTLSGGEAQRVKLAGELMRTEGEGRSVVVLDEPTTGLHASDVERLVGVLARLAARGDAVVVIEHHTDLLGVCDQLVELGPAGGEAGGSVIATGTPAELAKDPESVTGPWLGLSQKKPARTRRGRQKA